MELKQLEDRKHFKISFLPKKEHFFGEGGGVLKLFKYKTDFKKGTFIFINKSNNS